MCGRSAGMSTDCRVTLQSGSRQSVVVDCRKSQNVTSHQSTGLLCTVDVPPKSAVVCAENRVCYLVLVKSAKDVS